MMYKPKYHEVYSGTMVEATIDIIGREKELASLRSSLEQSLKGSGQTVLIGGEAGSGKSTLAQIILDEASSANAVISIGHATSTEGSEPYNPFRKALASLGDTQALSLEDHTSFDELFLISRVGLLITHLSSSEDESVDEDILSSMLTAVQDFVKDSFGDGEMPTIDGGLGRLEYRNKKVLLEHGDFVFLAGVVSGEEHPRMKGDLNRILDAVESEFSDILRDWDGDLDSVSGTGEVLGRLMKNKYPVRKTLESMNIEAERLATQMKIQEVLESKAENGLLLVLEDIHLADETTLQAIPYLSRNLRDDRIMICCTYEPDNMPDMLAEVIDAMKTESIIEEIILDSLSFDDTRSLISGILGGSDIPDGLVEMVHKEIGGNPFFTIEVLRTMLAQKIIFEEDGLWIFKSEQAELIPSSAADIVSRQLESMSLDTIHVIEFASVLGTVFDPQVISMGVEMDAQRVKVILDMLCEKELLSTNEDGEYNFRHGMVQEAIYSGLSQRWHNVLHRTAGHTIEFLYEYDIDSVLFKLARHFARTSEYEKGIDYSIEAGEKAANNYAPKEAAVFYEDASRLISISGMRNNRLLDVNITLTSLYELNGMYDEAIMSSQKAREACTECSMIASIDKGLGSIYLSKGEYDLSIESFESAIQQAKEAGDELLLAGSYGGLGKVYLRKGEYDLSLEYQENYLNVSKEMDDHKEIGQAYLNLGGVYYHKSDYSKTVDMWLSSLLNMELAEDEQGIAYALNNLGVAHDKMGKTTEAMEHYERCLGIKKKLGDIRGMAMAYNNIGIIQKVKGDMETSISSYKKSLEIRLKIGDLSGIANAYNNLGSIYVQMGDYETAKEYFVKYLGVVKAIGDTWGIARAFSNLGESEIELGQLEEALAHCDNAIELAEEHEFKDILAHVFWIKGNVMSRKGQWDVAFELFDKGIGVSSEIDDPIRQAEAYYAYGIAQMSKGDNTAARERLELALSIFKELGTANMIDKIVQKLDEL